MEEFPDQKIQRVMVVEFDTSHEGYEVGRNGVTAIEPYMKSGMYSGIPYVRVMNGAAVIAEFCQHNVAGVYYDEPS